MNEDPGVPVDPDRDGGSPALPVVKLLTPDAVLPLALSKHPPPLDGRPGDVRRWFDGAALAAIPAHDGTLQTARLAAEAYADLPPT